MRQRKIKDIYPMFIHYLFQIEFVLHFDKNGCVVEPLKEHDENHDILK